MAIYCLMTGLDAVASSVSWSETTKKRKPMKGVERWYVTDADRAPLGPLPTEIREEIGAHWALSYAKNAELPDTFLTLTSSHFSGVPFARKKVCDVFEEFSEGNYETIPIRKFWSMYDDEDVPEAYFVVNIYNSENLLDTSRMSISKVVNPRIGRLFSMRTLVPRDVFVRASVFKGHHLIRDAKTSEWFCDDVFRDAIDSVTPKTHRFAEVNEV